MRWPVRADPKAPDRLLVGPPQPLLARANIIRQSQDGRVIVACNRAVGGWQAYAGGWILHADRPNDPIQVDAGADIAFIAIDPKEGRWVVTAGHDPGVAKIWDARDGRLVKPLAEYGAGYPRFSPDSRWLSTYVDGGRLFAVDTWEPGPRVGYGAFAPDSRLMAVQPPNGVMRLVDRAKERELARLEDPDFQATAWPFFTSDGGKLIGISSSKGVCVWDLRLIRQHLKPLGLDWEYPEFRPADPERKAARSLSVEILPGDLAKPVPNAEQRARQAIERYRAELEAKPDSAKACNGLAWAYLTAPEPLRDV